MKYKMILMGASVGGYKAVSAVLSPLPGDFAIPIVVIHHQRADSDDYIIQALDKTCPLKVKFAEDKEMPQPANVYLAPPDYHLVFEKNGQFSLSHSEPVNHSRPSIDVTFISAAKVFGAQAVGVIMTGANHDGAEGLRLIGEYGGLTIVQNPKTAVSATMPIAALAKTHVDHIIRLDQIGPFLWDIQLKDCC